MLVVEDDPLILMTAAAALRDAGCIVVEAETADDAAAILQNGVGEVHVVFSDIEMPGQLNGIALAHIVRDAWPAISVVLTSGRVRPALPAMPDQTRFVGKPYDPNHVATMIVELTQSGRSRR